MARRCAKCKSERLEVRLVSTFYWRKECRACGSTGPFEPIPSPSTGATTSPAAEADL